MSSSASIVNNCLPGLLSQCILVFFASSSTSSLSNCTRYFEPMDYIAAVPLVTFTQTRRRFSSGNHSDHVSVAWEPCHDVTAHPTQPRQAKPKRRTCSEEAEHYRHAVLRDRMQPVSFVYLVVKAGIWNDA